MIEMVLASCVLAIEFVGIFLFIIWIMGRGDSK